MTVTLSASTAEGLASQLAVALSHLVVDPDTVVNSVTNGYLTGLTEEEVKRVEQIAQVLRRGEESLNQRIRDIEKAGEKRKKEERAEKAATEQPEQEKSGPEPSEYSRADVDSLVFEAIQKGHKKDVAKILHKYQAKTVEYLPIDAYKSFCTEIKTIIKEGT